MKCFAVGLLVACGFAQGVNAQQFLNQDILNATAITEEMKGEMLKLIAPAMDVLTAADPQAEDVSDAREVLLNPLRDRPATRECRLAFSELVAQRIEAVAGHESALLRINAQILLAHMTDDASKAYVDAGLADESVAVQRKAMEALQRRVQDYLAQNKQLQINVGFAQVLGVLQDRDKPPHPTVVAPALEILLNISSQVSQAALIEQLNNRVELHAKDPKLAYDGERKVFVQLGPFLQSARPYPTTLATGINRAAYRYALVCATQLQAGGLGEAATSSTAAMLAQSIEALIRITTGAGKAAPTALPQARELIQQGKWTEIQALLKNSWGPVLKAEPFRLTNQNLAIPEL